MAESTRLVDVVQERIDRFLERQRPALAGIAPDLDSFSLYSSDLLRGGKRFRALFCYWGWQSIAGLDTGFDPLGESRDEREIDAVMTASAGLEFFHAAALVHDDIMDNSDTRRGLPAAHRRFEALHREGAWLGSPEAFGRSGALLMGDLLLAWSDELLSEALDSLPSREAARSARLELNRMRTEVTVGQYLDILEENAWQTVDELQLLPRAQRVIVYKSAKYSVEAPLTVGAAMAGADRSALESLRHFGLPLGIAYQLRDDLLGVFGDPSVTGKPAGDDLREGKRTVLVATARRALPPGAVRLLDELLGDPELDDDQISMLQATLRDSGAVDAVEQTIIDQVERAVHALERSGLAPSARTQLTRLAETVTRRAS
ncbi:polyprenyl synthetase family protein [Frigoribacterium sp. Leaf44]|uniref:polyprenyl synthetase family protein n=1 Tax=Frigoribacterium sp. Leaf44 TaxID=1736220 RepID=UPI0006FCCFA8|nr:polyprenyl synthetase family protein [Frigoribacterium sp. Leaf44]KQN46017.1 geranylgeranyl pyrophosphate synthase [Frigoribacterium sp. Leaf44]